jgi:hypothetical protein
MQSKKEMSSVDLTDKILSEITNEIEQSMEKANREKKVKRIKRVITEEEREKIAKLLDHLE